MTGFRLCGCKYHRGDLGIVVEGESVVDESSLTGESNPIEKKFGEEIFAGTINLNGRLIVRVTATGETTPLAHVIAAPDHLARGDRDVGREDVAAALPHGHRVLAVHVNRVKLTHDRCNDLRTPRQACPRQR